MPLLRSRRGRRNGRWMDERPTTLSDLDRDAMQRAIDWVRQESPASAAQIEDKLAREGFEKAGHFASYSVQCDVLQLKPWQAPLAHTRTTTPIPTSTARVLARSNCATVSWPPGFPVTSQIRRRRLRKSSAHASREEIHGCRLRSR